VSEAACAVECQKREPAIAGDDADASHGAYLAKRRGATSKEAASCGGTIDQFIRTVCPAHRTSTAWRADEEHECSERF
jgi:predicted lipoprotein with Yx(FWY)xxD motif